MRLGSHARRIGAALVASILSGALGSAPAAAPQPAGGDLCNLLDLVLPLDCSGGTSQPRAAPDGGGSDASAQEATPADQVRQTSTTPRYDPGRIAVTFERGVSRARIEAVFAEAQVTLDQAIPAIRAYMVAVEPSRRETALASLQASPAVASAGPEVLVDALDATPNDMDWPQQWGLRVTRMPQAWPLIHSSSQPVVAIVDTGVDPNQPDLRGALVPGYDFVHQTATPRDDEGHGTAVAGIVAARTNNYEGIAGVCGSCLIMPVKVLDDKGVGDDSVIAAGIVWAVDHGARAINLSLGGPGTTPRWTTRSPTQSGRAPSSSQLPETAPRASPSIPPPPRRRSASPRRRRPIARTRGRATARG